VPPKKEHFKILRATLKMRFKENSYHNSHGFKQEKFLLIVEVVRTHSTTTNFTPLKTKARGLEQVVGQCRRTIAFSVVKIINEKIIQMN
jgi:hypothetical protein